MIWISNQWLLCLVVVKKIDYSKSQVYAKNLEACPFLTQ